MKRSARICGCGPNSSPCESSGCAPLSQTTAQGDCQKELEETILWLELLSDSETVKANKLSLLLAETNELMAIVTTIIKKSKD